MADAPSATVAPNGPEVTGTGNEQPNPPAAPSPTLPEPMIVAETGEDVGLRVLEAELNSLKSAMLEVTAVDETELPIHDIPSVDAVEDVAKAQLNVLLGIQSMVTLQHKTQQKAMKSHMLSARVVETCTKILSHHVNAMEGQMKTIVPVYC